MRKGPPFAVSRLFSPFSLDLPWADRTVDLSSHTLCCILYCTAKPHGRPTYKGPHVTHKHARWEEREKNEKKENSTMQPPVGGKIEMNRHGNTDIVSYALLSAPLKQSLSFDELE